MLLLFLPISLMLNIRIQATMDAGLIVGLNIIRIINEPAAATNCFDKFASSEVAQGF